MPAMTFTSYGGTRSQGNFAAALAMNNELMRVTHGQPYLYGEDQLYPIRRQIAQEYKERARMLMEARYRNKTPYYVGAFLFFVIGIAALGIQAYATITNDPSVNKFSGFIVGGVCLLSSLLTIWFAVRVSMCNWVLLYMFLLYAAMGVGVCGAINFIARMNKSIDFTWVAYALAALGGVANALSIVYFFMLACKSCSMPVGVTYPPSKIQPLPLPPGAQPVFQPGYNPNAAAMAPVQFSANPYPSNFQVQQPQPAINPYGGLNTNTSLYSNPQPIRSFNANPNPYSFQTI